MYKWTDTKKSPPWNDPALKWMSEFDAAFFYRVFAFSDLKKMNANFVSLPWYITKENIGLTKMYPSVRQAFDRSRYQETYSASWRYREFEIWRFFVSPYAKYYDEKDVFPKKVFVYNPISVIAKHLIPEKVKYNDPV